MTPHHHAHDWAEQAATGGSLITSTTPRTVIVPSRHEKAEWLRLSRDAKARGITGTAALFYLYSGLKPGVAIALPLFDMLQTNYRVWLLDGTLPAPWNL